MILDIETVLQNEKFLDVYVFDGMKSLVATKVNLYFYVTYYVHMYCLKEVSERCLKKKLKQEKLTQIIQIV